MSDLYDFTEIKAFANKQCKTAWYKQFCNSFDNLNVNGAQKELRNAPEQVINKLKSLSKTYYQGKPGHFIGRFELHALRFPDLNNNCECGALVCLPDKSCSDYCRNKSKKVAKVRKETMLRKYGADNPSKVSKFKKKRTNTIRKLYGVDNAFQSKDIKKKIKKTNLKKYGVDNPSKSKVIMKRKEETYLENFGEKHWTKNKKKFADSGLAFTKKTLAKSRATCIERYGVPYNLQREGMHEQISKNVMKKYGVVNAGCLPNGFRRKKVTDKFGKTHTVQGYEVRAIKYFEDIPQIKRLETKSRALPRYRYKHEGKIHNYYPDLMVFSKTKTHVIEVKSSWTLKVALEKNISKFKVATKRCIQNDMTFWLFYYPDKGKLIRVKNPNSIDCLRRAGIPV